MKKTLLTTASFLALTSLAFTQTTIYSEDFESGNSFTLNTNDLGGASTFNTWLVNNTYSGGSGTVVCMGFPFTFTVPNTPSQPGGITGSPSSNYMHISAQAAVSSGITCASYIPSDGGTCVSNESNFTKMTAPVSTVGYTGVSLDFWWMCAGSVDAYGELYYSTNGGTTWTLKQSNFNNVTNWTQTAITDPLWDNQASLQFGYRFVNNVASNAADPSFCIDEIELTGTSASSNTITTDTAIQPTMWCEGQAITIQVNFTSTGTFNAGNIYSAELSDVSGSFAAPTVIGTLSSTANSGMIVSVIPAVTPVGSGYRIRVVSDNPATIGSDNGTDLVINANPIVTQTPFSDVCVDAGVFALTGGSPSGGTYSGVGVQGMGTTFDPTALGSGTTSLTYTYTDGNGCSGSTSESITVNSLPVVTFDTLANVCHLDSPFTLSGGSPAGGTYSGPGVSANVFDPAVAGIDTHTLTYSFTDGNGCTGMQNSTITVEVCGGLNESDLISFQIQPNPVVNSFEIATEATIETVQLLDLSGRRVRTFDANQSVYSVEAIPAGIYLVRVGMDGKFSEQRIIVQ